MIKKAVALKPDAFASESSEDVDLDLGEVAQAYPLIPPGEYDVVFVKAHKMPIKKSQRLITYWGIQDLACEHHGTVLIMGFPYPKQGRKKWGANSKLAQCYRIAIGRNPDRYDTGRLSTNVFKNKIFGAQVVTVTKGNDFKGCKQYERSPENHYSVIQILLSLKVG
jgi:hypothetical protein